MNLHHGVSSFYDKSCLRNNRSGSTILQPFAYPEHINRNDLPNQKSQFDERISRFGASYGAALVAWRQPIPLSGLGRISRAELTELLIPEDGRPILIFGALLRVVTSNERRFMWFEEATTLEAQLKVFLEVTSEQARRVDWNSRDLDNYGRDSYAVVARIESVEYAGDSFCAVGHCVDLMPLSFVDFWSFAYPRWLSVL